MFFHSAAFAAAASPNWLVPAYFDSSQCSRAGLRGPWAQMVRPPDVLVADVTDTRQPSSWIDGPQWSFRVQAVWTC